MLNQVANMMDDELNIVHTTKHKWIKAALSQHHSGALHKQLGVNTYEHIPVALLEEIEKKHIGEYFYNHYSHKEERVTHLLKHRVNLALNLHKHQHSVRVV